MENIHRQEIEIPFNKFSLKGNLVIPENAKGFVIFSHGSGSSRFSPRNKFVADELNQAGFATLLTDLLTPAEDEYYRSRFNIELLTKRLVEVARCASAFPELKHLHLGFFGASTGAASALAAAEYFGKKIQAVVSRGGRPDLAKNSLTHVTAATLLIVGSEDVPVIALNKEAFAKLQCEKKMVIIPGATHLFEEPGKLEEVAAQARTWFTSYLVKSKKKVLAK